MFKLIEHIMQQILLIMLPKRNSSHIRLQQMPVVEHIILPSFEVFVQHSLPLPLLISQDPPHLMENLGHKHLLSSFNL